MPRLGLLFYKTAVILPSLTTPLDPFFPAFRMFLITGRYIFPLPLFAYSFREQPGQVPNDVDNDYNWFWTVLELELDNPRTAFTLLVASVQLTIILFTPRPSIPSAMSIHFAGGRIGLASLGPGALGKTNIFFFSFRIDYISIVYRDQKLLVGAKIPASKEKQK